MTWPMRFLIPYEVWRYEGAFSKWLQLREISGFFWEVDHYDDYVIVEVMD